MNPQPRRVESILLRIMVPVVSGLLLAALIGGVGMYATLSSMTAELAALQAVQTDQARRLTECERREMRYDNQAKK